ncbi:ankyrin repeat-containing domain protein [Chaetomium tenue]|uniref:Ankyrin repeat-containing domain protein n=1 Tax=Chaetomium tenue TaxID=1854479 RepID=A0ACB7PH07_9PEZI|nr:ankyrin repeat-containing domain protein [Chaetomium globosum]
MSEYWKSTPKYWCKHCSVFVRDTGLERANHESTGKHQGAIKRSLRDLHRNADQKERDKERAKREVDRLNGVVSGSSAGASGASKSATKPSGGAYGAPPQQASQADRRKQLEQLAELGVSIPTELRGNMAMVGEWTVTSTKVIEEADADGKDPSLAEGRATGRMPSSTPCSEGASPDANVKVEDSQEEQPAEAALAAVKQELSPPIKDEPADGPGLSPTVESAPAADNRSSSLRHLHYTHHCPYVMAGDLITPGLIPSLPRYLERRNEEYKALRHSWINGTSRYPSPPPSWPPNRCMLTSLAPELLVMICRPLYQADLFHLALTCRRLVAVTIDLLYRRDISDFDCLALRWACAFGIVPTLERTLSYGAPPSHIFKADSHVQCPWRIDRPGFSSASRRVASDTPLCTAILASDPEIVRLLIEHGADVNAKDPSFPPGGDLHLRLCEPGSPQIVRQLLDAGADPNQHTLVGVFLRTRNRAGPGATPLLLAMQSAVPAETVELLLEHGADPVKIAMRLLVAHGGAHELSYISGNMEPRSPLPMLYRHWGHPQVVEVLELFIANGADITSWAQRVIPPMLSVIWWAQALTPFSVGDHLPDKTLAATDQVCKVITLLAEATLDRDHDESTQSTQKSTIIDAVVPVSAEDQGIPLSRKGQTALRWMCRLPDSKDNLRIIRLLLKYGADMNSSDDYGRTALHHASAFSSGDRVRELVGFLGGPAGSGLVIDAADERGWTPLHYACFFGLWINLENQMFPARLLLENGATVSTRTKDGWTPLSLAALTANDGLVDLLLDYGAGADDLFIPREDETQTPLATIGRIVFHDCAPYSWPGPCPELQPMKAALAGFKARTVALLNRRLGVEVVLPPVLQTPRLPPDHQFQERYREPFPTFRADRADHPLGISSEARDDATSSDFEKDIDRLLTKLDSAGLEALVMAPPRPEDMNLSWSGTPRRWVPMQ